MTRRGFIGGAAALGGSGCGRAGAGPEAAHPPTGAFVTVDGLRVHHLDRGSGTPVVLIHGASGNLRDFSFSLVDRLADEGLRPIAFDRPGLGYSERPADEGWEPAVQARILRRAAAKLGVERAVVVGHSWGAAAAMAWALDAPESVIGVLSLAGATYPWGGDAGLLYSLGASPLWSGATRRLATLLVDQENPEGVVARVFRPNAPPEGYARHIGVGLALRPASFRANAEDLDNLHAALERMAPRYRSLVPPVEALHGEADRTVWASVHSEPLARAAPRGRLTLLPGVGHMPHHAAEDAVVDAIRRLAAGAEAGGSQG
jgi:pimeloyl-ACP methyl ester carboxylesterase